MQLEDPRSEVTQDALRGDNTCITVHVMIRYIKDNVGLEISLSYVLSH